MPKIDGFKLAALIQSTERVWFDEISKAGDIRAAKARKCPIVAVTAFDLESVKINAQKVGIERVLSKPVEI